MSSKVPITYPTALILQAVVNGYRYGFDIMDVTGLPSGTVYPALRRLENNDLITSNWEAVETAREAQRPPRKYYEITRLGEETLTAAVKRYRPLESFLPSLPKKENPSEG